MPELVKICINCEHLKIEPKTSLNIWGKKEQKGICELTGLDMRPFDYSCDEHIPVKLRVLR